MDINTMATASQHPPSYSVAVAAPAQATVYVTSENKSTLPNYLLKIRRTAIIQVVGGGLLVFLGIVAIILMGMWSYFATPIWTGILIYCLTGCIGLRAASSGNVCWIATYLTMSVISILTGFALFEMYIWATIYESSSPYTYYSDFEWNCQPGNEETIITNCAKSEAARQVFDALIVLTAFFMFVLCITASCFSCCAACYCCRFCCEACCGDCLAQRRPQTMAVYHGGHGILPVQSNVLQQGVIHYPNQQGMFIVQQAPSVPYPPTGGALPGNQQTSPLLYTSPSQQAPLHAIPHEPVNEKMDLP